MLKNLVYCLLIFSFINFVNFAFGAGVAKIVKKIKKAKNIEYAVYAAPHELKDEFLIIGNPKWGGIHITLLGFSIDNKDLRAILNEISENGKKKENSKLWTINVPKAAIKDKQVILESKTLDKIAKIFSDKKYNNIKGREFANYPWHISFEKELPKDIIERIKDLKWDLVIIKKTGDKIEWRERYPLYII